MTITYQYGFNQVITQYPRVCINRDDQTEADMLAVNSGLGTTVFDVEVVTLSPETSLDIAANMKTALHGYHGSFFGNRAQAVYCENQTSNYTPRSVADDSRACVEALRVTVTWRAGT